MTRGIKAMLPVTVVLILSTALVGKSACTETSQCGRIAHNSAPMSGPTAVYPTLDEPWDIVFVTNAGDTCNDSQLMGCEYAGGMFWITGANSGNQPNKVYMLDNQGGYLGEFDQWNSGAWGWRDLTFDGIYLYGSDSYLIDAFDLLGNPAPQMNITGPLNPCRGLAYDPATDHFWAQSFLSLLYEFDRNGTIYSMDDNGLDAVQGMAWDDVDPGGPWLWIFEQSGTPATTIHQYDPYNHTLTGFSYTVPLIPGCTNQSAGGLAFTGDRTPNLWVLIGIAQAEPSDRLFALEMYVITNPGNLTGFVYEAASSQPLPNATVVLNGDTTYTHSSGSYQFLDVPIGTYEVTASKYGYNPKIDSVEIFSDSTSHLNFFLTQPLIDVDIHWTMPFVLSPGIPYQDTFDIYNLGDGNLIYAIHISFQDHEPDHTDNTHHQTPEADEPWLAVSPDTGTIQPAHSETITAYFEMPDTAQTGDLYAADIVISNNSLVNPVTIPVEVAIYIEEVSDHVSETPEHFALYQNHPNPFNPTTDIQFDIPHNTLVTLTVYDLLGRCVATLINQNLHAGSHSVTFNGIAQPSGMYFYQIRAANLTDFKKMVLLK
jgi:hypothetical protein